MTCLCWFCETLVQLLFHRLVSRRRRRKQYSAVCGLPLSLTLPDGAIVAVRDMTDAQLLEILAIRRQAETLGTQPGLGITRCLTDDDFRSEVKGAHKFAITMVTDKDAAMLDVGMPGLKKGEGLLESREKFWTKGGGKRQGEGNTKLAEELTKTLEAETKPGVFRDASERHDTSVTQHSKSKRQNQTDSDAGEYEQTSSEKKCSRLQTKDKNSQESSSNGFHCGSDSKSSVEGSNNHSRGMEYPHVGCAGKQHHYRIQTGPYNDTPYYQLQVDMPKAESVNPSEKSSETDEFIRRGKKTKTAGVCGEQLVAGVILTDSKYYRGPSFVTPWSFVSPAYSGRGLDSVCLSISELMAKRLGYWGVYLDMLVTDWASVALVERKAGYMRVGTLPHVEMDKDGQPVGCHVYYKDLRTSVGLLEDKENRPLTSLREKQPLRKALSPVTGKDGRMEEKREEEKSKSGGVVKGTEASWEGDSEELKGIRN